VSDRRAFCLALLVLLGIPSLFAQQTLRIAAAADLQPVLPPLLQQFEHQSGISVLASYKSSATLTTQILSGAPFDLFLAADLSFPERVIAGGKAEENRPIPYARGTLVVWTRNNSGVRNLSLDALRDPAIHTIAIANPSHAPYGRAARQTLRHIGLLPVVESRMVIAENIAQAAQYADSGNAEVGFISLTSALTPRLRQDGHFLRVPPQDYAPLLQGAIVIRNSAGAAEAHRFLSFLRSPATGRWLSSHGLEPVPQSQP
jgi:molybdate transport system substrate-binding protein